MVSKRKNIGVRSFLCSPAALRISCLEVKQASSIDMCWLANVRGCAGSQMCVEMLVRECA